MNGNFENPLRSVAPLREPGIRTDDRKRDRRKNPETPHSQFIANSAGLLESVYEAVSLAPLARNNLTVIASKTCSNQYQDLISTKGFRCGFDRRGEGDRRN